MNRSMVALVGMMTMSMVGCMGASPDVGAEESALRGREMCLSSDGCDLGEHCSVEDGDCFSNCRPGRVCPAVCWGVCRADEPEIREMCLSSDNCERGEYCTVEDGDCFSNCAPGRVCPAVCWGTCRADERETCGTVTCGEGTTCCNPSCGVCTGPGEYCTQQICDSVSLER